MEMRNLVQEFSTQLEKALSIGEAYTFSTPRRNFQNIVLAGLGGSGIGGSIVQNYVFDRLQIPFWVNKEYALPGFVGPETLVIACSYSGNTEETLIVAAEALQKGATVIGITAGGALQAFCEAKGLDCVVLPGGMPPRACLGYSVIQILYVLLHFGLIDDQFKDEVQAAQQNVLENSDRYRKMGRELAEKLLGKTPIIYASGHMEGMAVRFRQQLNENSKMLGWHAIIPEMNHNELVGWRDEASDKAVVILRTPSDPERVAFRMDINKEVYAQYHPEIIELYAEGNSYLEQLFSLVNITDWCSVDLAEMRNINATEVKVIDALKAKLAEKPVI